MIVLLNGKCTCVGSAEDAERQRHNPPSIAVDCGHTRNDWLPCQRNIACMCTHDELL
jgi:hypothetical protein